MTQKKLKNKILANFKNKEDDSIVSKEDALKSDDSNEFWDDFDDVYAVRTMLS